MFTSFSLHPFVRRSLTLAAFAGAGLAVAGAQTSAPQADAAAQPIQFKTASVPSLDVIAPDSLFSSSNPEGYDPQQQVQTQMASMEKTFSLPDANAMQYGQRRRYGAPRYRGGNSNADGSQKYFGFAGAGLTIPTGVTHKYDTTSWSFQAGVGRNFNKNLGVDVQFDWDNFGLQGSTLNQQAYIEDPTGQYGLLGNTDGYSHVWSLTVDPIYNIKQGDTWGAYITAGGGFYHKITTFTTPQAAYIYYFGIPEQVVQNEPFDSYTSNAPGVNAGFGVTYKVSRFANERLYAEARYVQTFNTYKPGIDGNNYNSYSGTTPYAYSYPTYNLYPANSNRTGYIPIKFGLRF